MARKKYIITSAQACYYKNKDGDELPWGVKKGSRWAPKARPHENFLKGLETLAAETGAELMIVPVAGKNAREDILHKDLAKRDDIFEGSVLRLNKNLEVRDIVVPPQNVDPAAGKKEMVSLYNASLIFPHTKQRIAPVAVFNADLPRYLYTPGAVTLPNYNVANHRGDTAERQHVFGALAVEVLDEVYYNITNLRALKNGRFAINGKGYNGDSAPKEMDVDFMVLGDFHWGNEDAISMRATFEQLDRYKPKRVFIHDGIDGHSVNRHEKDSTLKRVREFKKGRLSLEKEFEYAYKKTLELSDFVGKNTEIYFVASNHHEFIPLYINGGRWMSDDIWNADIASYLYSRAIALDIPEKEIDDASYLIEEGIKRFGELPHNVHFLRLKDNLRRYGFQLASHGHKGSGGARGGNAKSRSVTGGGKSVSAHSHTMEVFGDTYIAGTNSILDQPYTFGQGTASIAANAVGYSNGTVQMLPMIEGRWMKDF